jgi:hypothetical protein
MSGYSRRSFASFGRRTASVAYSVAVMRIVPEGFSLRSLKAASSPSISSILGPTFRSRRSPAAVAETLPGVGVLRFGPPEANRPPA